MFTVLLALVDSFGSADFALLYLGTYFIDIAMLEVLGEKLKKEKKND